MRRKAKKTISGLLEEYLLMHDLRPTTVAFYRRTVGIFVKWAGRDSIENMSAARVSQFLLAKQQQGASSHYRKGLRNGLIALMRSRGDLSRVRPVRLEYLEHDVWDASQVTSLIAAVEQVMATRKRRCYWETIIGAAWYSGLSQCDLHLVTRSHVDRDGKVSIRRRKTGTPVNTYIPPTIIARRDADDGEPLWPLEWSNEWFREQFRDIVTAANLSGSFKKLRKSSGTSVEKLAPGRGHQHLAHAREIFELHYWGTKHLPPLSPETLGFDFGKGKGNQDDAAE